MNSRHYKTFTLTKASVKDEEWKFEALRVKEFGALLDQYKLPI